MSWNVPVDIVTTIGSPDSHAIECGFILSPMKATTMASARPFDNSSRYAEFVPGTIPPRKLNGGLYTGEPFAGDWGNVPIVPDAGVIANERRFYAYHQPVSHVRNGNNRPEPRRVGDARVFQELLASFPVTDHIQNV